MRPLPLPDPPLSEGTLLLRPWEGRDVEDVLTAGRDSLVSRFRYSLPDTPDGARQWVAGACSDRLAGRRLELAITDGGTPVGSVSLTDIADAEAMIRYWLLPAGRGRGVASAAVRLLAAWVFAALDVGHLVAWIEPDNEASQAVVRRCGFAREGLLPGHLTGHDGEPIDLLVYGVRPDGLVG